MNFKPFDEFERGNRRNMLRNPMGRNDSFQDSFDNFDRRFNFLWNLVLTFIGLVFIGVVLWYVVIGTVAVKLVDMVQDDGLKSVIERVWEGSNNEQVTDE